MSALMSTHVALMLTKQALPGSVSTGKNGVLNRQLDDEIRCWHWCGQSTMSNDIARLTAPTLLHNQRRVIFARSVLRYRTCKASAKSAASSRRSEQRSENWTPFSMSLLA